MRLAKVGAVLGTVVTTCAVGLAVAAPAMAGETWISGATDTRVCFISTFDGSTDASSGCGVGILGPTPSGQDFRGFLRFDVASNVPYQAQVTLAEVELPRNVTSSACSLGTVLRKQGADWRSSTPTWTTPDGGTTLWHGGEYTWSGFPTVETYCSHDNAYFDVTNDVYTWAWGDSNPGWEITADEPYYYSPTLSEPPVLHVVWDD